MWSNLSIVWMLVLVAGGRAAAQLPGDPATGDSAWMLIDGERDPLLAGVNWLPGENWLPGVNCAPDDPLTAETPAAAPVSLADVLAGHVVTQVYQTTFDQPLRVAYEKNLTAEGRWTREPRDVDWVLEGPGQVRIEDGRLHMRNPEGHSVLWNTRVFPSNFVAEWDFSPRDRQGLAIFFFAGRAREGGSVHKRGLAAREGIFKRYNRGDINCYHTSYWAISKQQVMRPTVNLRKNHGFALVADGANQIGSGDRGPHRVRVAKIGRRILVEVNGRTAIDWTDDGSVGGPPHAEGQVGLRQMMHTVEASYGYFRVSEVKLK